MQTNHPIRQNSELSWRDDGVPVSLRFDDPYFSIQNGLAETQHVFLAGNRLERRLKDGFHIAELGFGTGLNMLASLLLWRELGLKGHFYFTSFEAYPLDTRHIAKALLAFPQAQIIAEPFLEQWAAGATKIIYPEMTAHILIGPADQELAAWKGKADAWFLDGFSPAKNPELWTPDLMAKVRQHTAPRGSFATYTAAGHVRRALQAAGFAVDRCQGYGTKRHMTRGERTE
ncbi:MAG: tRNA U34 5-methylaminomethyl-2-thiouridine-forming methyltransferase MnmC [Paracoccaceae bacterium]|jgi:tRNA U34 5-methylaminomethyl-2-thiouridine-forming methyltransferase MnmC